MGKRKAYTPFSTSSEAGISAAPVEGYIDVDQEVKPTIDTGFVDGKGRWIGRITSDDEFSFFSKDEAIANGGEVQAPAVIGSLSMVGYNDIQIAIRVSNGGDFAIKAVMASDGLIPYYNLSPPNAAAILKGNLEGQTVSAINNLLVDSAESMTADVWNIFMIHGVLGNQARLGFVITNNSGDISDIETSFLRLV
jgi:hypothetical protein